MGWVSWLLIQSWGKRGMISLKGSELLFVSATRQPLRSCDIHSSCVIILTFTQLHSCGAKLNTQSRAPAVLQPFYHNEYASAYSLYATNDLFSTNLALLNSCMLVQFMLWAYSLHNPLLLQQCNVWTTAYVRGGSSCWNDEWEENIYCMVVIIQYTTWVCWMVERMLFTWLQFEWWLITELYLSWSWMDCLQLGHRSGAGVEEWSSWYSSVIFNSAISNKTEQQWHELWIDPYISCNFLAAVFLHCSAAQAGTMVCPDIICDMVTYVAMSHGIIPGHVVAVARCLCILNHLPMIRCSSHHAASCFRILAQVIFCECSAINQRLWILQRISVRTDWYCRPYVCTGTPRGSCAGIALGMTHSFPFSAGSLEMEADGDLSQSQVCDDCTRSDAARVLQRPRDALFRAQPI